MKFVVIATPPHVVTISPDDVLAQFRKLYPNTGLKLSLASDSTSDSPVFEISGIRILAGVEKGSVNPTIFDFALKSIGTWSGAEAASNSPHLMIVSLHQPNDHITAFAAASAVTIVAAAITSSLPVTSVLFTQSALIKSPVDFQSYAVDYVSRQELPVDLWISVAPDFCEIKRADRAPMVFSLGLHPFIGREIEFSSREYSLETMIYGVLDAASYLISRGLIVQDGETMGFTPKERIRVRYRDEGVRPGIPILELSLEAPDSIERKFKGD